MAAVTDHAAVDKADDAPEEAPAVRRVGDLVALLRLAARGIREYGRQPPVQDREEWEESARHYEHAVQILLDPEALKDIIPSWMWDEIPPHETGSGGQDSQLAWEGPTHEDPVVADLQVRVERLERKQFDARKESVPSSLPQPAWIRTDKHLPGPVWEPDHQWRVYATELGLNDVVDPCVHVHTPDSPGDDVIAESPAQARAIAAALWAAAAWCDGKAQTGASSDEHGLHAVESMDS